MPFNIGPMLTPLVLLWYFLTEAGSIIENCGRLGAPVPKWFQQKVNHYKDAIDNEKGQQTYMDAVISEQEPTASGDEYRPEH